MNRSVLALPIIVIVCCLGVPLLFGGAGLTLLVALKSGPSLAILVAVIVVVALVAIYAYRKRGQSI